MSVPVFITHITDCHDEGQLSGGLAAVKVKSAYHTHGAHHSVDIRAAEVVGALPFNTIDAGVKAADLYHTAVRPHNGAKRLRHILAVNAAPPKNDNEGAKRNERENMVVGTLKDGTIIGGTIKGYSLSYLKGEIDKLLEVANTHDVLSVLYGDLHHDGMRQFRSHYLLTHLLLDFARGALDEYELQPLNVAEDVPDPHPHSHVATIDNFGNVKLWLSKEDEALLAEIFAHVENGSGDFHCGIAFGWKSLEVAEPDWNVAHRAVITKTMFSQAVGTNVLSALSSSGHGGRVLPQLCTLQSVNRVGPSFALPTIGAPVRFDLK